MLLLQRLVREHVAGQMRCFFFYRDSLVTCLMCCASIHVYYNRCSNSRKDLLGPPYPSLEKEGDAAAHPSKARLFVTGSSHSVQQSVPPGQVNGYNDCARAA